MENFREKGFTLLELLFALSIICTLLAISIFSYSGYKARAFETVTKEDLRRAYSSAFVYFIDYPEGKVSRTDLEKYGFKASPNVNIRVINGRLSNLLLISFYSAPGVQAYMAYSPGVIPRGVYNPIWLEPIQGWGAGANPPANPQDSSSGEGDPQKNIQPIQADLLRVCNRATLEDLQGAHRAAQEYFRVNPEGTVTKEILRFYGYIPNENVNLAIISDTVSTLSMSAFFNIPGATNYTIDSSGNITENWVNQ